MTRAKLPIGIQDLGTIISDGYTYVDKTQLIYELITRGKYYFLSRPRRFGKSLLISTLQAIFSGEKQLFDKLWINTADWEWIEYPIIMLDMSKFANETPEIFAQTLTDELINISEQYHISVSGRTASDYLKNLIEKLYKTSGQKIVVLIDEYDKPLLDQLTDMEIAKANQKILRAFYTILKAQDKYLKFVFLTGVTQFAKVNLFSGLNNLTDLSMLDDFDTLLGYTKEELEHYFSDDIQEVAAKNHFTVDECYSQIKEWYNGYQFSPSGECVYNPFSVLNLINSKVFKGHWSETGTPSFLIDLIKQRHFDLSNLEQISVDLQSFISFDIEDLPMLPILYQAGYLTIKSFIPQINAYSLSFPNREVSQSFSISLLHSFAKSKAECSKILSELSTNLYTQPWNDTQFFEIMQKLLALIPYDLYVMDEKYFHSLFYLIIKLAGFQIGAEIHTQQGRTDAALFMKEKIIIFEFKFNANAKKAIEQIKEKKYNQFFQEKNLPILLVGVNFNGNQRTIDDWQMELLS